MGSSSLAQATSSGSSLRGSKSVRFSKKAFVYRVRDYSGSKYCSLIWYSASEMADCKKDAALVAETLENLGTKTHEDWRGLEARGPQGKWDAYKILSDAKNAVLDAQDKKVSTSELASVIRDFSVASVDNAIERARMDARVAANHCKEGEKIGTCASQVRSTSPDKPSTRQNHRIRHLVASSSVLAQRA